MEPLCPTFLQKQNSRFKLYSPAASKVYVPPPVGGIDIVFFGKVIGCTSGGRMPPLVSGEFFGPRVEKNMLKH